MADNKFFEISKEQSRVKTAIVSKYFDIWAQIMMAVQDRMKGRFGEKIAYLDLFAGPGRYEDGTKSTPLVILEHAIANEKLRNRLQTIFNDKDENNTKSLENAIHKLPGIGTLKYPPMIRHAEIGTEIVKLFEQWKMIPTFFFVDPWGYKGLSLQLVNAVLKDWGCDCLFFFNYNRISMGLPNELVEEHMNALFGEERANKLRARVERLPSRDRELEIVEELCQAIKETGKKFVLPFRFKDEHGRRTSHHLIFVSKDFRGYEIMREVMARESSSKTQGVASFEYNPATARQRFLFELNKPLDQLEGMLLDTFADRMLTRDQVYQEHSIDRPYIKKNYTEALLALEAKGKVAMKTVGGATRQKGKLGPKTLIRFPPKR
jgi:three-Cys-motif partner protein